MYSKKILFVIPLLVIIVLSGVIYMDSNEHVIPAGSVPVSVNEAYQKDERSRTAEPDPADMHRILEIEQQLDTLNNKNLAVAFYGELIQIYIRNGRLDGAAEASGRLAALTDDPKDWRNAGDWYHQWMLEEDEPESIHYFSLKSIEKYEEALKIDPHQKDLKVDVAVEYMRVGNPEFAIRHLEEVLSENVDFLKANYNLGVILHQIGNKDKSISYLRRSLELAQGTDYEELVQDYLRQSEIFSY